MARILRAATLRDPDRRTYFKEEVGGLVMGGYEPNPQGWVTGDIPENWEFRLFDDDYDHFGQHLEQAIARIPALADWLYAEAPWPAGAASTVVREVELDRAPAGGR